MRDIKDRYADSSIEEIVRGRAFIILGKKDVELSLDEQSMKARGYLRAIVCVLAPVGPFTSSLKVLRVPHHELEEFSSHDPDAPRTLSTSVKDYIRRAVARFKEEYTGRIVPVTSPYLSEAEWGQDAEDVGLLQASCASHSATVLFVARVCRPECFTAVQRLCSNVTKWSTVLDKACARLFSFLENTEDWELVGKLSPLDIEDLRLDVYPDADWNGDAATSRSISGFFLELVSTRNPEHRLPLTWKSAKQTFTGSSTAETETVSASSAIRHEAIPIQVLFETLLGRRIPINCRIDNLQVTAIKKGYSKKLRYLQRCHRVALGALNELISEPEMMVCVGHIDGKLQKGVIFTKSMPPVAFLEQCKRIGLRGRLLQ